MTGLPIPKSNRSMAILRMGCLGVASCAPQQPSPPKASGLTSRTIIPQDSTTTTAGTPQCIGVSICPPPPPDAEGNPACYYADGWRGNTSGVGIEVWYFREPQNLSKPDQITAVVRKKDGTNESQDTNIDATQQVHRFEFSTVDTSAVQEVLLNTSNGRCFVIGQGLSTSVRLARSRRTPAPLEVSRDPGQGRHFQPHRCGTVRR